MGEKKSKTFLQKDRKEKSFFKMKRVPVFPRKVSKFSMKYDYILHM